MHWTESASYFVVGHSWGILRIVHPRPLGGLGGIRGLTLVVAAILAPFGGAGLDTMLVQSTREEQESQQHLFPRAPPPEFTSSTPPALTTSTPPDAADTAERTLTPLVWGDTKLLPDGLSPGDTASTLTKLLNFAWALTASTIDSQKSQLPQPPATMPAPPNLGTPR